MNRNNISIFFNEKEHKYTDYSNRVYTSVTTVIGHYENKFDTKKFEIAKACETMTMARFYMESTVKVYANVVKTIKEFYHAG